MREDVRDIDCELEYSNAQRVQAAAGPEKYIAFDRRDIAYSVKTALHQMSTHAASRCADRSLSEEQSRLVWKFPYQQQPKSIDVSVDAAFATKETTLTSTFGVAECLGKRQSSSHQACRACEHCPLVMSSLPS